MVLTKSYVLTVLKKPLAIPSISWLTQYYRPFATFRINPAMNISNYEQLSAVQRIEMSEATLNDYSLDSITNFRE